MEKTEKKWKVVVVDDQRFARMYVEMHLDASPRYEIAASLPFARDLPEYLSRNPADLVILDVVMAEGADGLAVAAKVKKEFPGVKIILCTSLAAPDWMEKAKEIGAESFWYKEYSKIPLIEIMDRTMAGESVYLDEVPDVCLGTLPSSQLSARQKELLRCLIAGMTNREIAEKLFLSANTVKSYLDDIMEATGIHSRTELAVRASRLGLSVDQS